MAGSTTSSRAPDLYDQKAPGRIFTEGDRHCGRFRVDGWHGVWSSVSGCDQLTSANARFIALAVRSTASSGGRRRSSALNGSARTGPS